MSTSYVHDLLVKFRLDAKGLRQTADNIGNSFSNINKNAEKSSTQLKTVGLSLTAFSAAAVGFGYKIMNTFGQFEQSMANTQSVVGANKEQLEKLTSTARNLGEISVFSASQAADAMYYLGSAGYKTNQIIAAIPGTLNLAAATQTGLADATRYVVSTLSAFELSSDNAGRVSNVFAATISNSQATMEKLGESMKYFAPIANAFGWSIEQTSAALGLLYNAGFEGSQAGVYLRQSMLSLAKPTKDAEKTLAKYGLTAKDINPETNDLANILRKLKDAGIGAKGTMGDMATIFDKRAAPAMKVLLNAGEVGLKKLEESVTGTSKASDMAKTQIDTFFGSIKLMQSVLEEVAINIGDVLAPAMRYGADLIGSMGKIFNSLPNSMKSFLVIVPAIAAGIAGIAGPLMLVISKVPAMIAMFKLASSQFVAMLGPVGLITAGVVALGLAVAYLVGRQERQTKALYDNIASVNESLGQQIEQKRSMKSLSDEYISLANKSNRTKEENDRMREIYRKLKTEYPDLISGTMDYAKALKEVEKVGALANKEMTRLQQLQKQNQKLKLSLDLSEAQKVKAELLETFSDKDGFLTSISKAFDFSEAGKIPMLTNVDKILKSTSRLVKSSVDTSMLRKTLGEVTVDYDTLIKKMQQYVVGVSDEGIQLERINKIRSDMMNITAEQTRLQNLDNQYRVKASGVNAELTDSEKKHWDSVKRNLNIVSAYSTVYNATVKEISKYSAALESAASAQDALDNFDMPEETIDKPDDTVLDSDFSDEKDKAEERKAFLLDIELQLMKARLDALKKNTKDSLDVSLEAAQLERDIKNKELDKDMIDRIKKAKELNVGLNTVVESGKLERENIEAEYLANVEKLNKEFQEKLSKYDMNRIENDKNITFEELNNFRAGLVAKSELLKSAGKIWTEEYYNVFSDIRKVDDIIEKRVQDNIGRMSEKGRNLIANMNEASDEGRLADYIEYAKQYRDLLVSELDAIETFKGKMHEDYGKKLAEIHKLDRDVNKRRLEEIKHYATQASNVLLSGFDVAFSEFERMGLNAKIKIADILGAIKQEFTAFLGDLVKQIIRKQLMNIFMNIFGGGLGNLLGIPASISGPVVPSSSIGSYTKTGGVQLVHPNEGIAKVNRMDNSFYKHAALSNMFVTEKGGLINTDKDTAVIPSNVMSDVNRIMSGMKDVSVSDGGEFKINRGKNTNVIRATGVSDNSNSNPQNTFNINITNPIVDDTRFWDKVYTDKIIPAINKNNKRLGQ